MLWGKIIGGLCGYFLFGPFGLILGVIIGHYFDLGLYRTYHHSGKRYTAEAQKAFFDATFLVMGYVAKSDGHVSENEINAARTIMAQMHLSAKQKQHAIKLFQRGKQSDFKLQSVLKDLKYSCRNQQAVLQMFIDVQVRAASADGFIGPTKQRIIILLCTTLGVSPVSFAQSAGSRSRGRKREKVTPRMDKDPYDILGIKITASDAEIKKSYRKLMSQNHPDKLIAKGVPQEMIKMATEKTQEIQHAYEQIRKLRQAQA